MSDEVPFVDDEDDGAAGLVRVAADVGVEGGDSFGGVEDEEADVGGLGCLRAMMTESFSAMRRVLPLRWMPAVSTKRKS